MYVILVSCVDTNTGYRIVGKDGKVLYMNRQRTEFNREKLKEQQQNRTDNTSIVGQGTNKNSQTNGSGNTVNSTNGSKKIDENLALDSSAYSLRSVVDTIVKNEDINDIARVVDKNQVEKTIKDFDIPEYYFNSSKYNVKQISNATNQSSVNTLQTIDLANDKKKKSKVRFLSGIFSGNEEKKVKIAKANVNQLNNRQPINETGELIVNNQNLLRERYNNDDDLIILDSKIISGQNSGTAISINNEVSKSKKSNNKQTSKDKNSGTKSGVSANNNELSSLEVKSSVTNERVRTLPTTMSSVRALPTESTSNNSRKSSVKSVKVSSNSGLISKKYYIQIGSFRESKKAENLLKDFVFVGTDSKVVPVEVNNTRMYRAVIGTFNTKNEATVEMKKLLDRGHKDAFVFYKK